MEKKVYHEQMYKYCKLIHESTNLDIELIDTTQSAAIQFQKNPIPKFLEHTRNDDYMVINKKLNLCTPNQIYYFTNNYMLTYIAVGVWQNNTYGGAVITGPFILHTPNELLISDIMHKNKLQPSMRIPLQNYYKTLQNYNGSKRNYLGNLIINIINHPLIETESVYDQQTELVQTNPYVYQTFKESYLAIEKNYEFEEKLLYAVEKGLTEEALKLINKNHLILDTYIYVPNNLFRSAKDLLLIANALYCRTVIKGGVHPVYADSLAKKYIILIEKAYSNADLAPLNRKMLISYCDSVKKLAIKGYSPIITKAIEYIRLNLIEPLSLQDIAEYLHINASYLSTYFKKETGLTITAFIQQERVEKSKYLMVQGEKSIIQIAQSVGYNDSNYFTRIFKKTTTMTPTEYMKSNKVQ